MPPPTITTSKMSASFLQIRTRIFRQDGFEKKVIHLVECFYLSILPFSLLLSTLEAEQYLELELEVGLALRCW